MNAKVVGCLAAQSDARTVNLLQNRQVRLHWDRLIIQLRMADLLVLNHALQTWMDDVDRVWASTYVVALNEYKLFLDSNAIYHFCAMVAEATQQLPRRTVRWADLTVTITPYAVEKLSMGSFSRN